MKRLKLILTGICLFVLSSFVFVGCSTHKYELVGIIENEGDDGITLTAQITDETMKKYVIDTYGSDCYIRLKQNGEFEMGYAVTDVGLTVTYKQVGTYTLKQKENSIIFSIPRAEGEPRSVSQQYLNGMIIYYDGTVFLAFK